MEETDKEERGRNKLKKEVQEKAREESALAMREWSTGPNSTKQQLLSQKPALPSWFLYTAAGPNILKHLFHRAIFILFHTLQYIF